MSLKNFKNYNQSQQGFSLVEALAALTILTITIGFVSPLFVGQRVNNLKSEIRTGAVAVSQQILDELRQIDPTTLRSSGSDTRSSLQAMGYTYEAKIYYCENLSYCSTTTRQIRVEVKNNGQTVYNVETVYTQFR